MTTIAYRAGILASDSRGTWGTFIVPEKMKKLIVSAKHGCIYAIAGTYPRAIHFVRLLEKLDRLPWNSPELMDLSEFQDGGDEGYFSIIILQWDGRVFTFEAGVYSEIEAEFYAIGSGAQAACAAMTMGADACKAIQIASHVDSGTDDRVTCFGANELKAPAYLTARGRSRPARSRSTPARSARPKSRASRKKPA